MLSMVLYNILVYNNILINCSVKYGTYQFFVDETHFSVYF